MPTAPTTLVEVICAQAAELGEKPAFEYLREAGGTTTLTYGALLDRARAVAVALRSGARPGDRVLVLSPPGLESVEAFFGCLFAGVVAVPVAPPHRRRTVGTLLAVAADARPAAVLSLSSYREQCGCYPELQALRDLPWVDVDRVPTDAGSVWIRPSVGPDDLALLQYTSGTTAAPRGVMITHRNLMANCAAIQSVFGSSRDSRAVFWLPLYHDMGLVGGVVEPVFCGGMCTMLSPATFLQHPIAWLEAISRTRATISGGPDFAYALCADRVSPPMCGALDLSCWDVAFAGAETVRPGTLERFARVFAPCGFRAESLLPCYGLAEATLMVTGGPRGRRPVVIHLSSAELAAGRVVNAAAGEKGSRTVSGCGRPVSEPVAIVDPATRIPCPDRQVGEIWVCGPSVAQGYFGPVAASAETFGGVVAGNGDRPFLRTGDLGFISDGELFVTGRIKDMIVIRGAKLPPEDIETAAEAASVALRPGRSAAFTVEAQGQEVVILVQEVDPRAGRTDGAALVGAIREVVARECGLALRAVALVKPGSVPMTSSGKRRRGVCRDAYQAGTLDIIFHWQAPDSPRAQADGPPDPPRIASAQEIREWLAACVAARLPRPESLGMTTPFADMGLTSLDAVELTAELERWVGKPLQPTVFYNYPDIASLAQWLVGQSEPATCGKPEAIEAPTTDPLFREVSAMSDGDIEILLRQEAGECRGRAEETDHAG